MRTRTTTCILFFFVAVAGCSGSGKSSNDEASPVSTGAAGGGGGNGGTGGEPGGAIGAHDIVFNEIAPVGSSEWIEIANKGSTIVDLSDYAIADSSKKTGAPKLSSALRLPIGTKIDPGARIVIMTSKKDATAVLHPKTECLPNGPDTCFFASFGVSATGGEALHLLAPDNAVLTSTAVPATASADAGGSTTETQCRLPDLTGDFTRCAPTPGMPNHAPE